MVLGNRGEPLIQQILQTVVVHLDDELATPQIQPPMSYGVYKANELPFVGGEGAMARRDGAADEGDRVGGLYEHRAEAV